MVKLAVAVLLAWACSGAYANGPVPRVLDIDERVRAERAIESVDPGRHVEPLRMLELQAYWGLAPTDAMLERELTRLAREIADPARLARIYAALEDDDFLIKECLARPALVDRLSRDLYAFDPGIHARARTEAVELRGRLLAGELSPFADRPGRVEIELRRESTEGVGHAFAIQERRDGFVFDVVLSKPGRSVRLARYTFPKTSFDAWWGTGLTESTAGPDLFSACGVSGSAIALRVDDTTTSRSGGATFRPLLLDASGEPIARSGDSWVIPYTGAYLAGVAREATATPDDYRLAIDALGSTAPDQFVDLDVTTTDAPDPADSGGLLTFTIAMQNAGPSSALDAEMLFLPPDATSFDAITFPAGGSDPWRCVVPRVGAKGKISCTTKCFAPGAIATFTVRTKIDACLGSVELTSQTTALSASPDSNPGNNVTIQATTVVDPGTCDDGNLCTAGDHCGPGISLQQNFDEVAVPFLPSDWTATLLIGPVGALAWRTVAANFDTEPNSVFSVDAPEIRDAVLDSPPIPIVTSNAQLRFRNRFNLEKDNDGSVLEISIDDGPFVDIVDAGGSFVSGDYNGTIRTGFASPIAGRRAWTGLQTSYVTTLVNLPANAAGTSVVLRWRLATDLSLGNIGQWIDSVSVSGRNLCVPGGQPACDDNDPCTNDACDPGNGCANVPFTCDDGNPCTDDICNPILQCVHVNNTAPCDDGDACTLTDRCAAGACLGSTAVTCHDADMCTADSCDPALRCVSMTADLDGSGFSASRVDGRDLAVLADAWISCPGSARYVVAANLDRQDACIGPADFHLFMNAFGRTCSP